MEKKYYLVIFGIIIILIIFGLLFIINTNYVNLDGTYFKVIEGYKPYSGENFINFTNDDEFILIKTSNSTLNSSVNSYLKTESNLNITYRTSNLSLDGLIINKVTLNNYPIAHYWFEKNNKVYEICSWNYNGSTDLKVFNLIKSAFP